VNFIFHICNSEAIWRFGSIRAFVYFENIVGRAAGVDTDTDEAPTTMVPWQHYKQTRNNEAPC
jgi:hypothetical protein